MQAAAKALALAANERTRATLALSLAIWDAMRRVAHSEHDQLQ